MESRCVFGTKLGIQAQMWEEFHVDMSKSWVKMSQMTMKIMHMMIKNLITNFLWYGESLTHHSWFLPISVLTRVFGKPISRMASHGKSNGQCLLPDYTLSLWGPWHTQTLFIASIHPITLTKMCLNVFSVSQRCTCQDSRRKYVYLIVAK